MDIRTLGISTSWNASGILDGRRIVEEVKCLGFDALEVEYRVREEAIEGIKDAVARGIISVTSVHNFSPLGRDEKPSPCGGDKLSLASLDEVERSAAVRLTRRSLDLAKELGARALVLHTGEVEGIGNAYFDELSEIIKARGADCDEAKRLRDEIARARSARRGPHLEAVKQSLEDLLPAAEEAGVRLCIENRYFYHQIPIYQDVIDLLNAVQSDLVRYWHDIGHGHTLEVLGFLPHRDWLARLKPYVFGVHIHDAIFTHDHRAPGKGEIDLKTILAIVPSSAIKVLELASSVEPQEIRQALDYLERI